MSVPSHIDMIPVSSTNVAAIGYDPGNRCLYVAFLNGRTYRYDDVPPAVWDGYQHAHSKGQYHWHTIRNSGRDDRYTYTRIQ